jgi:hypothetical protein
MAYHNVSFVRIGGIEPGKMIAFRVISQDTVFLREWHATNGTGPTQEYRHPWKVGPVKNPRRHNSNGHRIRLVPITCHDMRPIPR